MKKNNFKKLLKAIIGLIFIAFLLISCNKNNNDVGSDENHQVDNKILVSNEKSIQDKIRDIGFFAFPEPIPVEPFSVPGLKGDSFSSDDLKGKISLLNFWAPWCPPCRSEMPHLEEFYKNIKDLKNFQLVAIAVRDKRSSIEKFVKDNNHSFPIFFDENATQVTPYISQGIPTTYIVNKDGKIIAGIVGAYNFNSDKFKAFVKELAK